VFVDAKHAGTSLAFPLRHAAQQEPVVPSLDRRASHPAELPEHLLADSAMMLLAHLILEGLRGPLIRKQPGKPLPEIPAAIPAMELAPPQHQPYQPFPDAFMANPTNKRIFLA